MIRLVATDLDGTLLRSDLTVSNRTRKALARARAHALPVVFMTGRPLRWLDAAIAETQHRSMVACANGALIWNASTQQAGAVHRLDPRTAISVADLLRSLIPDIGFAVERLPHAAASWTDVVGSSHPFFACDERYVPRWPLPPNTPIAPVEELVSEGGVVKLLARAPIERDHTADSLLALTRSALRGLVDVTHSNSADLLLEMSAYGVNKGTALADIADHYDVDRTEVAAIGDMPNDASMLDWAGRAYAVSNAHPDVVQAADDVLPSNDEDGVATLIESILPN